MITREMLITIIICISICNIILSGILFIQFKHSKERNGNKHHHHHQHLSRNRKFDVEIANNVYLLSKRQLEHGDILYEMIKEIKAIKSSIASLSSSVELSIKEIKEEADKSIMPTPALSDMIQKTIEEQIVLEMRLSSNMKAPKAATAKTIIDNVVETYPFVNQEYLVKKTLAMIQMASDQRESMK